MPSYRLFEEITLINDWIAAHELWSQSLGLLCGEILFFLAKGWKAQSHFGA